MNHSSEIELKEADHTANTLAEIGEVTNDARKEPRNQFAAFLGRILDDLKESAAKSDAIR